MDETKMLASEFANRVSEFLLYGTIYAYGQLMMPISDIVKMEAVPMAGMAGIRPGMTTREYAAEYRNARSTAKSVIEGTFGADCSGIVQAALGRWAADTDSYTGGAKYGDEARLSALDLAKKCGWTGKVSSKADFENMKPGYLVFQTAGAADISHVGVYIGDKYIIECAYPWCDGCGMDDGVQALEIADISDGRLMTKRGELPESKWRRWLFCGPLPELDYEEKPKVEMVRIPKEEYESLLATRRAFEAVQKGIELIKSAL